MSTVLIGAFRKRSASEGFNFILAALRLIRRHLLLYPTSAGTQSVLLLRYPDPLNRLFLLPGSTWFAPDEQILIQNPLYVRALSTK